MLKEILTDFLSVPWIQDYILRSDAPLDRIDSAVRASSGSGCYEEESYREDWAKNGNSNHGSGEIRLIVNRRKYSQLNLIFHDAFDTIEAHYITDHAHSALVFRRHAFLAAFDKVTYKVNGDAIRRALLGEKEKRALPPSYYANWRRDTTPTNSTPSPSQFPTAVPVNEPPRIIMNRQSISDLVHKDNKDEDHLENKPVAPIAPIAEMRSELEIAKAPKKRPFFRLLHRHDAQDDERDAPLMINNNSTNNNNYAQKETKKEGVRPEEAKKRYWDVVVNLEEEAKDANDGGGVAGTTEVLDVIDVDADSDTNNNNDSTAPTPKKRRKAVPPPSPNSSLGITPRDEEVSRSTAIQASVVEEVSPGPPVSRKKRPARRDGPAPPPRRSALRRTTVATENANSSSLQWRRATAATFANGYRAISGDSISSPHPRRHLPANTENAAYLQRRRAALATGPIVSGTAGTAGNAISSLPRRGAAAASEGTGNAVSSPVSRRRTTAATGANGTRAYTGIISGNAISASPPRRCVPGPMNGQPSALSTPLPVIPVIPRRGRRRIRPRVAPSRSSAANNSLPPPVPARRRAAQERWRQRKLAEESFWRAGRFDKNNKRAEKEKTGPTSSSPAPAKEPDTWKKPPPSPAKKLDISHLIHGNDNVNDNSKEDGGQQKEKGGDNDSGRKRISMVHLLN